MSQSVEAILASCNLSRVYGAKLKHMGYVDVPTLASMSIEELQDDLQMKRGHARQLRLALSAAASAAEPNCDEPSARIDSGEHDVGREEQMQPAAASAAEPKGEEPSAPIKSDDNAAGGEEQVRESPLASDYGRMKEDEQEHAVVGGLALARVDVASESHAVVADGREVRDSSPLRAAAAHRPRKRKNADGDSDYESYSSSSSSNPERTHWPRSHKHSQLRSDSRGRTAEREKGCRRECSRSADGRRGASREICRLFVRYNCNWGDRCRYAHDMTRAQQEAHKWFSQGNGFSNATVRTNRGYARVHRSEDALARRLSGSRRSRSRGRTYSAAGLPSSTSCR
jgi:hypothetical protein